MDERMENRHIDGQKLQFHPRRVQQWLDGKDSWETAKYIYPIYVEVSPMGACNHRCTFCAVDYIGYKSVILDPFVYYERIYEMGARGVRSVMFAGEGEPLLHKKIDMMVNHTLGADVDVSFTTNGVLLHKLNLEGISWVKVSMNAGTAKTYAKIHRTKEHDFGFVWQNIREAVKRKKGCEIGVQMVLLPENQHEVQEFEDRCTDAGVDYIVLKPYSQHKFSITKQYEGFRPIKDHTGRSILRQKSEDIPYEKCQATPYFWAYIMASGDVYSCSAYLLDERFRLGNINKETFKDIWEGERRRKNWELVSKDLDIHECRLNCRMHQSNLYLEGFKRARNANFI